MHNKQHWSRTCLSEYACTKIYKSSIPRWLKPRPRRSWRPLLEKNRYNFVRVLSTVHLNSSVLEAHLKVDVFLVSFAMNPWVSSGCTPPVEHWILGPPPTYLLLESQKVKPRMFGKFLLPLCLQQMEIWLEEEPFPWRWMGSKSTTDRRQSSLEPISPFQRRATLLQQPLSLWKLNLKALTSQNSVKSWRSTITFFWLTLHCILVGS